MRAALTASRSTPWRSSEARSAARILSIAAGSLTSTALTRSLSAAVPARGSASAATNKRNKAIHSRRSGHGAVATPFFRPLTPKPFSARMLDACCRFLRAVHLGQPLLGLAGIDRSWVGIEHLLPGFAFSRKAAHPPQRRCSASQPGADRSRPCVISPPLAMPAPW